MSTSAGSKGLSLIHFDRECLERSWAWLSDPEIAELTMTEPFLLDDQLRFFEGLPKRTDYTIWGINLDGFGIIGATGLKNQRGTVAEYWGYIGERQYWGKGLGKYLMLLVEAKARELGFESLYLKVISSNSRAISLYKATNFIVDTSASTNEYLCMTKDIASRASEIWVETEVDYGA